MLFRRRRRKAPQPTGPSERPPVDTSVHGGDDLIECSYATAVGARADNQDRCAISPCFVVLSDGAGGHAGGAIAAQLSVEAVVSCFEAAAEPGPPAMDEAVARANASVRERRRAETSVGNMAATLTVALATSRSTNESRWLVGNVGDSRAWLVTEGTVTQVTEDDNVAAQMVRSGTLTPEQAAAHPGRNWITRAIGPEEEVVPKTTRVLMKAGDALLIASDGLDVLSTDDIHAVVSRGGDAAAATEALVAQALRKGSLDNVTAALVRHRPAPTDSEWHGDDSAADGPPTERLTNGSDCRETAPEA